VANDIACGLSCLAGLVPHQFMGGVMVDAAATLLSSPSVAKFLKISVL
jgi:hypothetical protein